MAKLNDTQTILLSTAAQRDSGSIFPLSPKLKPGTRVDKAVAALQGAALIEDRATTVAEEVRRTDGDLRFGLYVTPAGLAAIGIANDDPGNEAPAPLPAASPRTTKSATVITLLQRDGGATLAELIAATGWLPHTTRAALTGLRKRGYAVERGKRGNETCYSIKAAA